MTVRNFKKYTINGMPAMAGMLVLPTIPVIDIVGSPSNTTNGARYIVNTNPTGAFAGNTDYIMERIDDEWERADRSQRGQEAVVQNLSNTKYVFTGNTWILAPLQYDLANLTVYPITVKANLNQNVIVGYTGVSGSGGVIAYSRPSDGTYHLFQGIGDANGVLCVDSVGSTLRIGAQTKVSFHISNTVTEMFAPSAPYAQVEITEAGISVPAGAVIFPSTQVSSSNANALDDYEEGTFTPIMSAASPPTGVTYSSQLGRYTKIGRFVSYQIQVILTSKGSGGTGDAIITGLPFTATSSPLNPGGILYTAINITTGYSELTPYVVETTTTVRIRESGDQQAHQDISYAAIAANSDIRIGGTYPQG